MHNLEDVVSLVIVQSYKSLWNLLTTAITCASFKLMKESGSMGLK